MKIFIGSFFFLIILLQKIPINLRVFNKQFPCRDPVTADNLPPFCNPTTLLSAFQRFEELQTTLKIGAVDLFPKERNKTINTS